MCKHTKNLPIQGVLGFSGFRCSGGFDKGGETFWGVETPLRAMSTYFL